MFLLFYLVFLIYLFIKMPKSKADWDWIWYTKKISQHCISGTLVLSHLATLAEQQSNLPYILTTLA